MASVLLSSITGSSGSLRLGTVSAFSANQYLGVGGIELTATDISSKTTVINATGKFAFCALSITDSGTGGNLFLSITIDGTAKCTDLDTGSALAGYILHGAHSGSTTAAQLVTQGAPIIVNSNITIALQKTGATNSSIRAILIPLE